MPLWSWIIFMLLILWRLLEDSDYVYFVCKSTRYCLKCGHSGSCSLSLSVPLLSVFIDHYRILVLQCRTQQAGGHEDFVSEQKVSHTRICGTQRSQLRPLTLTKNLLWNYSKNDPPIASFPESNFTVSRRCSRIFSGVPDITVYLQNMNRREDEGKKKKYFYRCQLFFCFI